MVIYLLEIKGLKVFFSGIRKEDVRVYLYTVLLIFWSYPALSQFDSGTTIFVMGAVSDLQTVIADIDDEDKEDAAAAVSAADATVVGDTFTVTIPVRQEDGSYVGVDVSYKETEETRTITIPDREDISLVQDGDGNYSFELTPEQIKGSSNVSCKIGSNKKGSCTIEPFITMVGDKVLSSDKLVLDYTEGENLVVAGGKAHNLKLTDENSETGFYNSETDAGDASVGITFSKNGAKKDGPLDFITTPAKFKDQNYLRFDIDSSKLTHTVRNPNDPTQTAEKFSVKDGGVSSSLIISREDHLNINFAGTTHGGISYDSDPFSERSVLVDTSAPISANLIIDNNPEAPMTSLSMGMMGSDSEAIIVDNRDPNKTDTITASGSTFLNLSQATLYDEESGKVLDDSRPVAFELGSNSISVVNEHKNGKKNSVQLDGIKAAGTISPKTDNKDIQIGANSVSLKEMKSGKLVQEVSMGGDVRAIMQEDDQSRKIQGMADHAYYNNGEAKMNLSGGAFISVTEYKKGENQTFNGKEVKSDSYAMANSGTIISDGTTANIEKGIEFRQIGFRDNSTLVAVNGNNGSVGNSDYGINLDNNFSVVNETDKDGKTRFTQVTASNAVATDKKTGNNLSILESSTTSQLVASENGGEDTLIINHTSDGVKYQTGDGKDQVGLTGVKVDAVDAGDIKYGSASVDNLNIKSGSSNISIVGINAAIYSDNEIKQGEIDISSIKATQKDYSVDIKAVGLDGVPGNFKIMFFENAEGVMLKIFGEDGRRIHLDSLDKDGNYSQVLVDTLEYLETDKFKSFMVSNLSGSFQNIDKNDGKLQSFNMGRISAIESIDGSFRQFEIVDGNINSFEPGSQTGINFESGKVIEVNEGGARFISGAVFNGSIDHVKYNPGGLSSGISTSANITFGSAIGSHMEGADGKEVTVFQAKDIELVAVDYDSMVKASGKVGEFNFYEDSRIQSIEAKDLKDLKIEDTKSGLMATLNGDRVVRVVERDESGIETGSYLLMKSTVLDIEDKENGVSANLRVGLLEFAQDKINDRNIILEADVEGRIDIDKTKSPIAAEAKFALKGKNLTTSSHSYISDDGKTIENSFSIIALGEAGRLDKLELSAGPSFLKDAISLQAKGSEAGGKELSFTFRQDKGAGTYYVRAEFKDGDKVKVKLFPFTLESKKVGKDALAEISLTPKGQNYMNHMEIISNVVSAEEITDWLDISAGGMIIARTGTLGGFGFEMMYQNQEYFMPSTDLQFSGQSNKAATYGLGVFHKNKKGDRTSIGLMLSGDSEIEYQTNGRGVLQIMGVDMDKEGSIPTTINLYMKKKWKDGDSLYGGVFVDGASYLVDEDAINDDARFFDGGRGFGRAGATFSYSKNLGEGSNIVFTGGANNNFKDPAFCVTFKTTFGGSSPASPRLSSTIKDSLRAINRMPSSVRSHDFSPTVKGAVSMLNREINETGHKIDSIKAIERITASLDKTLKAMENGSLTESNLRDHYNIQRDDLKKLKEYELKTLYDDRLSRSVENLTFIIQRELSRKGQVRKLKEREREIRRSMDALTNAFGDESSAEIMNEYSKKVEELNDLNKSRS